MITKLIKKLNKRKHVYKTYETNQLNILNNYIKPTLTSPLIGDGNVSLKIIVNNKQMTSYFTLPNSIHYPFKRSDDKQSLPKLTTFQAELNHNNFFPFNLFSENTLEDIFKDLPELTGESEYFVVNMIIKKIPKQENKFLNQYEQFAKGVEVPSSNPIVSAIQNYCIDKENDINYIPIDIINVIENKITDHHYQFQLFFGMKYSTKEKEELVKGVLQDILDGYSHLNSFVLDGISNDSNVFLTNELLYQYSKYYISLSEICSLFYKDNIQLNTLETTSDEIITTTEENEQEVITPSPQQAILQPTSTYALDTLPSLELLPVQIETTDDDVDMEIPKRLESALRRIKILNQNQKVKLVDFKVGESLVKTTIGIPNEKNFTHFKRGLEDIQVALGVPSLSITQGEVPDSVSFFIPREKRQPIYLRTLLESDEFIEFAKNNPLPFVVGKDPLGNTTYADLNKLTHLLVSGQTDSGKSVWLNQMILTLLMLRNSADMMMYLIDPKQVELEQFREFPQVKEVIDDMTKANKLLEQLVVEMEKRYTIMKNGGVKKIKDYNQKFPNNKLPYVVIVIDEYADLKTVNPVVDDFLARLGQKARGAGIHLVVATQRPDAHVIEKTTANNLPSKISFRLNDNKSYTTIFGTGIPYTLNGYGHGVMRLNGQIKDFEQFQGAIISINSAEEEETFEKIKKSFKGEKVEGIKIEKQEPEEVQEEPIIKMKRIIAETGECRVGELRKLMEMNTNVVTDLMQQLADEGWLNRPDEENRKWSLNEECEELNKLRQMYGVNNNE